MNQKSQKQIASKGDSISTCSSGLSKCHFVKQRWPVEYKNNFNYLNSFAIFQIFCLKYLYHIFCASVLWSMRHNDFYAIKSERWLWKQGIRYKCTSCVEKRFAMKYLIQIKTSSFPCFPSPIRRFSTCTWQNVHINTTRRAIVCDVYISWDCAHIHSIFKEVLKTIVFILNLWTCSNIFNF